MHTHNAENDSVQVTDSYTSQESQQNKNASDRPQYDGNCVKKLLQLHFGLATVIMAVLQNKMTEFASVVRVEALDRTSSSLWEGEAV